MARPFFPFFFFFFFFFFFSVLVSVGESGHGPSSGRHGGVGGSGLAGHDLGQSVHLLLDLVAEDPGRVSPGQDPLGSGQLAQVVVVVAAGQHLGEAQRVPGGPAPSGRDAEGQGVQRGQLAAAQLGPLALTIPGRGQAAAARTAGGRLACPLELLLLLLGDWVSRGGAARGLAASALDGGGRGSHAVEAGQLGGPAGGGLAGRGGVQRQGRGPVGPRLQGQGGVGLGPFAQRGQVKAGRGAALRHRLGQGLHTHTHTHTQRRDTGCQEERSWVKLLRQIRQIDFES